MTKLVWVLGPTAVGKDTLINTIYNDISHPLIKLLGLESPFLIQRDALLLRHEERDMLELKIFADRDKAKTILLKWQGHDFGQRTIFKLKELMPNAEFFYIFLDAHPYVIKKRREKRGNPGPVWDDAHDRTICIDLANQLAHEGIEILWFDTTDGKLSELKDPPST